MRLNRSRMATTSSRITIGSAIQWRNFTQAATDVLSRRPILRAKNPTIVTREDIQPNQEYAKDRKTVYYPIMREHKKIRRVTIGPFASVTFENYDLNWIQIQEMLFIENGGENQISDELAAYNALIPKGKELMVTLMFEIDDPVKRAQRLGSMGQVEDHIYLEFGSHKVRAQPAQDEEGIERTTADGKTSAIHFLRFAFNDTQMKEFLALDSKASAVRLQIEHDSYPHGTKLSAALVEQCKLDLQVKA